MCDRGSLSPSLSALTCAIRPRSTFSTCATATVNKSEKRSPPVLSEVQAARDSTCGLHFQEVSEAWGDYLGPAGKEFHQVSLLDR